MHQALERGATTHHQHQRQAGGCSSLGSTGAPACLTSHSTPALTGGVASPPRGPGRGISTHSGQAGDTASEMMMQLLSRATLAIRPQLSGRVPAPYARRPQITRFAATQGAAEPPEPQREHYGVISGRYGMHYSRVVVPRSQVHLLPESLRRPGKDGRVQLHGGTYSTAEEAARATDRWVPCGPRKAGTEA